MYTKCIFCHRDLGRNEAIEEFPVGRRLAYDEAKGRLWVVCRRCERWNLSPLETRWEAIEALERAFRSTRTRVSSDNVGLAKLKEGLTIVRIGNPMRPEFAAWRYGDQFGRRRRKHLLISGSALVAGVGVMAGSWALLGAGGAQYGLWSVFHSAYQQRQQARVLIRTRDSDGAPVRVLRKHMMTSRLLPSSDPLGWDLALDHIPGWEKKVPKGAAGYRSTMLVPGTEALGLMGPLMASTNKSGGNKRSIELAVRRIEQAGHPEAYLAQAAREAEAAYQRRAAKVRRLKPKKIESLQKPINGTLAAGADPIRLALEMALHEEDERRALEGELRELEARWKEAEEIARIADNLLLPEGIDEFLEEASKPKAVD